MAAPPPKGILSTNPPKRDAHVTITAPEPTPRTRDPTPPPPPTQVTAPAVNFAIKDEVEMLRAGAKNRHGDNVPQNNNR
ncbi:Protein ZK84.5 [Aphelenchoides avenae]|nr:Protein ZK84.5 [Aphelenchus avenae]KAH7728943.1 Protein ZK84.5 [Aphelenchus avenae]